VKEKEERQTGKQVANKVKRSTSRYGDINICMYKKILIVNNASQLAGNVLSVGVQMLHAFPASYQADSILFKY